MSDNDSRYTKPKDQVQHQFINKNNTVKKRSHHHNQPEKQTEKFESEFNKQIIKKWPLEAMPIQKAILDYGKRTAALGAQHGAAALQRILIKLNNLQHVNEELQSVIELAEEEVKNIRIMLYQIYDE